MGNSCWCKFPYILPKIPQNKLSHVLISYARATRPHPCSSPMAYSAAWCTRSRFMSLFSFCFDRTNDQQSLGRLLKDLAKHIAARIRSSLHVARSKFTQKNLIVQIFVVFIFACRTHMRNMQKLAPYEISRYTVAPSMYILYYNAELCLCLHVHVHI